MGLSNSKIDLAIAELNSLSLLHSNVAISERLEIIATDAAAELDAMRKEHKEIHLLIHACFPMDKIYVDDKQALREVLQRIADAENEVEEYRKRIPRR